MMLCSTSSGYMAYNICVLVSVEDELAFLGFVERLYAPAQFISELCVGIWHKTQLIIMWNSAFFLPPSLGLYFPGAPPGDRVLTGQKKDLSIFYFPCYNLIPPQFPPEFLTVRTRFP